MDAAAGKLPDVFWLYAPFGDSEHPSAQTVHQGAAWTAQWVLAVAHGPLWTSTVIIITWDNWGGWFDQIASPYQAHWTGAGPTGYHGSQFR